MTAIPAPGRRKLTVLLFVGVLLACASRAFAQAPATSGLPPGWITPPAAGLFPEPGIIRKVSDASDGVGGEPNDGPFVQLGNMITGAGWIAAGPGYRRHVLDDRARLDVSAALSWKLYKVAQARFEVPHLGHDRVAVGAQAFYQDLLQVDYFGLGDDSLESDRSAYRFRDVDILGYARARATSWLTLSGRFGWIGRPDLSTASGRGVSVPNTLDHFDEGSAPGLRTQPSFLHGDATLAADWRDHPGHPTRGGLYRATAALYADRDGGAFSVRRYEAEASQFFPLFGGTWVLALHGWEVVSDASNGGVVPFYLMPSLGGHNTLRGYDDYRFHDADMQAFNAESRFALFTHVDAVAFADAGKVAPRAGGLDFTHLKTSYGAGLRLHNASRTLVRLDVGHGAEGWRVFVRLSDPLARATPDFGKSSVVPFVP